MNSRTRSTYSTAILLGVWLALVSITGLAHAEEAPRVVATAVSVQGLVEMRRSGATDWEAVRPDERLYAGDSLRVSQNSRAALVLQNRSVVRLDAETTITLHPEEKPTPLVLRLIRGAAHFFSHIPRSLEVSTPFVNGAVKGTEFFVRVTDTQALFSVFRGRVVVANDAGQLALADDTAATAVKGQAPTLRTVARPRDAVHWALYYPPLGPLAGDAAGGALTTAADLLSVGRADAARAMLEQVLAADAANGDALALTAIIDLAQNRKDDARKRAQKALAAAPTSSAAKMALAYVRQADFDVDGARELLLTAVAEDPQNGFLWARLSELWLAGGHRKKALAAADNAGRLAAEVGRHQTVLGFARIAQVKIAAAKEAFGRAIELEPADPLPRLGLGLALIREGQLAAGRGQIEIAAVLDPGNALVRSYLGKAFYEERNDPLASRQFEVAKALDPNDPTPHFYSAIQKQSQNRPVEALYDLDRSIALNGNRAVYRSKLLLDQDLAARSASLAGLYRELDFERAALAEGWRSANSSPLDHSAHLLLAGSYAELPRHEIARVSELLQAQMLQPINLVPIQPLASESDLSVLERSGLAEASFNEYNALFNRDRFTLQLEGLAGEHETYGNYVVHSAVVGPWSYSLGQYHFETDGFRENNDLNTNLYTAFTQVSVSPETSIQAEYRHRNFERGDLNIRFDPESFAEDLREEEKSNQFRLGLRHAFTPAMVLLASLYRNDADFEQPDIVNIDESGVGGETQVIFDHARFDLIAGAGRFTLETDEEEIFLADPDDPDSVDEIFATESDTEHANYYTYLLLHPLEPLTLTLGGSYDDLNTDDFDLDEDQFNPKLGLAWEVVPGTLVRAAAFRTFERTLLFNQTLEPTQVAGFNQFYVDGSGADVWHYGIGIDQRFSPALNVGAEYVQRDITVVGEIFGPMGPEVSEADWDEDTARVYLYSAPVHWLSVALGYSNEQLRRPQEFQGEKGITELTTHRVSVGANFFHRSGLRFGIKPTYVEQYGTFGSNMPPFGVADDDDRFWVVDASVQYRLPKRLGALSLEARNLFDQSYKFQDSDLYERSLAPERFVLAKLVLSF